MSDNSASSHIAEARSRGTVKWFDAVKGYGFLLLDGDESGKDIFVHQTVIKAEGFRSLNQGDPVEFKLIQDHKGLHAEEVSGLGGSLLPASARPQPKQQRAAGGMVAPAGFISPHGLAGPFAYPADPAAFARFAVMQPQAAAALYATQAGSQNPLMPSAYYAGAPAAFVGGVPAVSTSPPPVQSDASSVQQQQPVGGRPQRGSRGGNNNGVQSQQQHQQGAQAQQQPSHGQQGGRGLAAAPAGYYGNLNAQGGQPAMFAGYTAGPNGSLYPVMPYAYGVSPVAYDPNAVYSSVPPAQQQSAQAAAPLAPQPVSGKLHDVTNMMSQLHLQQQQGSDQGTVQLQQAYQPWAGRQS